MYYFQIETAQRRQQWLTNSAIRLANENEYRIERAPKPLCYPSMLSSAVTRCGILSADNMGIAQRLNDLTQSIISRLIVMTYLVFYSTSFRFMIYVNKVSCDAPKLQPSTCGRKWYWQYLDELTTAVGRQLCSQIDEQTARVMNAQMVQFPELRLIEYDCGKGCQLMSINHSFCS